MTKTKIQAFREWQFDKIVLSQKPLEQIKLSSRERWNNRNLKTK